MLGSVSLEEFKELKEQLHTRGELKLNARGSSMKPVLSENHTLHVSPVQDASTLKRFDLIVFLDGEHLICHYLWHINRLKTPTMDTLIRTRPLSPMGQFDDPISFHQVLGKIESVKFPFWLKSKILLRSLLMK